MGPGVRRDDTESAAHIGNRCPLLARRMRCALRETHLRRFLINGYRFAPLILHAEAEDRVNNAQDGWMGLP